jgi:hypothetical protein
MKKITLNEEVGKIREMMGLTEEMGVVPSQNPTGVAKKKWDSGLARSGPGNPVVDNNSSYSIRTTHGKGNPIELGEEEEKEVSIEDFSEKRMSGAEKIVDNAKEKGGLSLLTYHHFEVKLSYYEKAAKGELDMDEAKEEYDKLIEKLQSSTKDSMNIEQIEFQELVGKIEVLGELIIENK